MTASEQSTTEAAGTAEDGFDLALEEGRRALDPYRPIPVIGAACGLRQGELFGLAEEDIDYDAQLIHVRRQVKNLRGSYVFALPKSDRDLGVWKPALVKAGVIPSAAKDKRGHPRYAGDRRIRHAHAQALVCQRHPCRWCLHQGPRRVARAHRSRVHP